MLMTTMDTLPPTTSVFRDSPLLSSLSTQLINLSNNLVPGATTNESRGVLSLPKLPTLIRPSKWPQPLLALEPALQSTKIALHTRLRVISEPVQNSIRDSEMLLLLRRLVSSRYHAGVSTLRGVFRHTSRGGRDHLFLAAVVLAAILLLLFCIISQRYHSHRKRQAYRQFAAEHGCQAPAFALSKSFFASKLHKLQLLKSRPADILDVMFVENFRRYGTTYVLLDKEGRPAVVHTLDPANVNAVLNSAWEDYHPSQSRRKVIYPLAQEGLLLTHGEKWYRNRKLILRRMDARRARDVSKDEAHIQELFNAIGPAGVDGWTETVDLLDLFHRMALDTSTAYLLGASANSQAANMREAAKRAAMAEFDLVPAGRGAAEMSYNEAFETVRDYFSRRSKLGSLCWMADSFKYRRACQTLTNFADEMIAKAVEAAKSSTKGSTDARFGLLDGIAQEVGDPKEIRNIIMDLFIAGQNMTGTMAAFIFAQLEHRPELYRRVREEILEKFGTEDEPRAPLTWPNMQACTTLQHVILETLRHYPLVAALSRNTCRDTVLPRGGGPDGMQPLAVPKGAVVTSNVYLMHRREEEWGSDAWEFKPDRWAGRKFGPEYAPFGGGPRQCVGQQLSMTAMSFMTTRMLQRFESIQAPEGQDNLVKGFEAVLIPKNGVKVRLRVSSKER